MENGKKPWMQGLTLALCAVLTVVTVRQGRELRAFREQTEDQMDFLWQEIDEVEDRVSEVSRQLEEADKLVTGYVLEPTGLDTGSRSLLAEASVTLKEWRADTQAALLLTAGEETTQVPLTQTGDGVFTAPVAVPVALPMEEGHELLALEVAINSGGTLRRETLGTWDDLGALLSVQLTGYGGSTPRYRDGTLTQSGFSVDVADIYQVGAPVFRLYRNGEPVWEQSAKKLENQLECRDWTIPYEAGDVVEITFACRDTYGLGYEFPLTTWTFDEETPPSRGGGEQGSGGHSTPFLTWPE